MEPVEIVEVDETVVACDGGDGPLGHPRVYLHMNEQRQIECPYCGRRFLLRESATRTHGAAHGGAAH